MSLTGGAMPHESRHTRKGLTLAGLENILQLVEPDQPEMIEKGE